MRRSHGLLSRQNEGAQTKSNVSPHTVSLPLIFPSTSIFSSPRRDTLCQRFIYLRWIVVNQKYGDCSQKSRQSSEMMSVGHCNSTNISLIWWRICKLMKWGELRVNGKKKKKNSSAPIQPGHIEFKMWLTISWLPKNSFSPLNLLYLQVMKLQQKHARLLKCSNTIMSLYSFSNRNVPTELSIKTRS